jgi:hypothetical protein
MEPSKYKGMFECLRISIPLLSLPNLSLKSANYPLLLLYCYEKKKIKYNILTMKDDGAFDISNGCCLKKKTIFQHKLVLLCTLDFP